MLRRSIKRLNLLGPAKSLFSLPIVRTAAPTVSPPAFPFRFHRNYSISTDGNDVTGEIDAITQGEYHRVADEYMETLSDELETVSELFPQVDAELSHGVLTLELPPYGTYVINKQPPNQQIWLSSPVSGPKRYDLVGGRWITLRDNTSLTETIETELSSALGEETKLQVEQ